MSDKWSEVKIVYYKWWERLLMFLLYPLNKNKRFYNFYHKVRHIDSPKPYGWFTYKSFGYKVTNFLIHKLYVLMNWTRKYKSEFYE